MGVSPIMRPVVCDQSCSAPRQERKMDYVLTEHARDALKKRHIQIAWMERALTRPEVTETDPVDADLEHRLARIPEFGHRVLRVIVTPGEHRHIL
ncbi:hypothetical protein RoseRS_2462 [Roseiflexus sp. RS-1]|nr:hypothetical protein RoseRS_2462 [Roseiflexus sp. RS-1]